MFNKEQQSYMNYLARTAPEKKCWCGWYRLGECPNCPPGKSSADKIAVWCPECRSSPSPDLSRPITHSIGCSHGQDSESPTPYTRIP